MFFLSLSIYLPPPPLFGWKMIRPASAGMVPIYLRRRRGAELFAARERATLRRVRMSWDSESKGSTILSPTLIWVGDVPFGIHEDFSPQNRPVHHKIGHPIGTTSLLESREHLLSTSTQKKLQLLFPMSRGDSSDNKLLEYVVLFSLW